MGPSEPSDSDDTIHLSVSGTLVQLVVSRHPAVSNGHDLSANILQLHVALDLDLCPKTLSKSLSLYPQAMAHFLTSHSQSRNG